MDMTPAEVATCICDIYEKLGRLECRLENTRGDLVTTIERNRQHTEEFLNQQTDIENKIDIALTTAVHELIEYLRYQDIQALDEEEFLLRSQGSSSRASVQQEIICCSNRIKMVQKARKIKVFRAFTISKRADMV